MPWSEVRKRAATNPQWQWHRMDALDDLKTSLVLKDQWREEGGYVEKPPFPKPQTDIRWYEAQRDDETGEVTLKLTAVHGDTIYYEVGAIATTSSQQVTDPKSFKTQDLMVSFLCVDSRGEHEPGGAVTWRNRITLKSVAYQDGSNKKVELQSAPTATIRYTIDGSDPKISGVNYQGPFVVQPGTVCVLAIAEKDGLASDVHRRDIKWEPSGKTTAEVKPEDPATWTRSHNPTTTKDSYEFLGRLKKFQAEITGVRVIINNGQTFLDLSTSEHLKLDGEKLEATVNYLRGLLPDGEVEVEAESTRFPNGQLLLDWVAEVKTALKPDEVQQ